ncbi:vanadium-dependent haloperoxidase [Solwaraspora sp. WMMB762]|uniref:vanadium-dependent haloperoxidase n=1 Tax=Solwaraspora sp. WMMB762 TaxID=3404120 RepID=UPI003B956572
MGRDLLRRRGGAAAAVLALVAPVAVGSPAAAASTPGVPLNAVVVWDANAQTAIWDIAGQQPAQVSGRSFAMVSGAVYDAVNAIAGTPYQPYLVAPRSRGFESTDAAVGAAAHRVLQTLFPAQQQRLQAQYEQWLGRIPDGRAKRGGIAIGEQTAAAMIVARHDDGAFGDQLWTVGTGPGQWRPTPPGFGNAGAWFADLKPFLIPDPAAFRTAGPPALTSRAYARDVNEIQRIGAATSTVRTADQTEAARWWHDRRSPSWEIKRQIATSQRLDVLQTARLFAMVDITGTDAAVACNDDRDNWSFWRPITAIQLADTDGNPHTTVDPDWTPLLVTPPQPDHPSGNTCGTGARMAANRLFFGTDRIPFSAYSVDTGTRRHFHSFSQATAEVVEARIWGGIHFRSADVNGARLGEAVAEYIARHHFQPLRQGEDGG